MNFLIKYGVFKGVVLLWVMWIVTFTVFESFLLMWDGKFTTQASGFSIAVIGLLTVAVGFMGSKQGASS